MDENMVEESIEKIIENASNFVSYEIYPVFEYINSCEEEDDFIEELKIELEKGNEYMVIYENDKLDNTIEFLTKNGLVEKFRQL